MNMMEMDGYFREVGLDASTYGLSPDTLMFRLSRGYVKLSELFYCDVECLYPLRNTMRFTARSTIKTSIYLRVRLTSPVCTFRYQDFLFQLRGNSTVSYGTSFALTDATVRTIPVGIYVEWNEFAYRKDFVFSLDNEA